MKISLKRSLLRFCPWHDNCAKVACPKVYTCTSSWWNGSQLRTGNSMSYHYDDVIIGTIASQITSLMSVYSTVYSGADQSKHQCSASLAFVWGIHRGPVNSPHKWPVTRKMFPFDDVIMPDSDKFNTTWSRNLCTHSHRTHFYRQSGQMEGSLTHWGRNKMADFFK